MSEVRIKKGKSVGRITSNQSNSPLLAPSNVCFGKQSIKKNKTIIEMAVKICFIKDINSVFVSIWDKNKVMTRRNSYGAIL